MAEWSKAFDSSSNLLGGVGSNPTVANLYNKIIFFFYFSTEK